MAAPTPHAASPANLLHSQANKGLTCQGSAAKQKWCHACAQGSSCLACCRRLWAVIHLQVTCASLESLAAQQTPPGERPGRPAPLRRVTESQTDCRYTADPPPPQHESHAAQDTISAERPGRPAWEGSQLWQLNPTPGILVRNLNACRPTMQVKCPIRSAEGPTWRASRAPCSPREGRRLCQARYSCCWPTVTSRSTAGLLGCGGGNWASVATSLPRNSCTCGVWGLWFGVCGAGTRVQGSCRGMQEMCRRGLLGSASSRGRQVVGRDCLHDVGSVHLAGADGRRN